MFTELFLMVGSIAISNSSISLAWMSSDEIEFKARDILESEDCSPILGTFFKHLILAARKITDLPAPWI